MSYETFYLEPIKEFLDKKIILISGPRQSGKTTLSKMFESNFQYLNFDHPEHRDILKERSWDRSQKLLIFDEVHKMKNWKSWLKGIYDVEGLIPPIFVTGSARLDIYKKMGDSLAGRYFRYRLHPFDIRELDQLKYNMSRTDILNRLLKVGGFPEPFLDGRLRFYNLWQKTHLDIIIKQDLMAQEVVKDIQSIEILIDLLRKRVGSPISYSALAEDLLCSDKTVKRWLGLLENMFVIFKLTPLHKNMARSNLKQPKYYFYDIAQVTENEGARLENLVAASILKECQFRQDAFGENWELNYLKKRGGVEVDFVISNNDIPRIMIEVKTSEEKLTKNFSVFDKKNLNLKKVQLVKNLKQEKTFSNNTEIRRPENWLCDW